MQATTDARTTLSVAMVVRDAEDVVGDAIASAIELADEFVVLDTGSVDGTLDVVRSFPGVIVRESAFDGFGPVKQRALDLCTGDWVLSLDADERLSPELAARIVALRDDGTLARHAGYEIPRRNWILGRAMTSMGLQDDTPLRLFRRTGASFDGKLVDEGVVLPDGATTGRLDTPIEHHTLRGIDHYLRKQDHYTSLDLAQNPRRHRTGHLIVVWPSTFWREYVARRGWRDGWPGLLWASLTATGRFMRDMKLWIAHEQGRTGETATAPAEDDPASR